MKIRDLPRALVSLDQEKAFNIVNDNFLLKVLKKFKFNSILLGRILDLERGSRLWEARFKDFSIRYNTL